MKIIKKSTGIALVFTGSLLLIASFLLGLTNHNTLLLTAWTMITVGIIVHIVKLKRDSRY